MTATAARETIRTAAAANGWAITEHSPLSDTFTRGTEEVAVRVNVKGGIVLAAKREAGKGYLTELPGAGKLAQVLTILTAPADALAAVGHTVSVPAPVTEEERAAASAMDAAIVPEADDATPATYVAVRAQGRYRVVNTVADCYVAAFSSKAKAEEKAAKLNAEAAAAVTVPEGVPAADGDRCVGILKNGRVCGSGYQEHWKGAYTAPNGARYCRQHASQGRAAAEAVAPLAVVTLDGEEQAVEVTATPEAPRYTAVRAEGRNKVLDRVTGKYTTCASRVAAEEKAAKLNRQHETETRVAGTAQAAEDAVTAVYERFAANRAAKDEDAATVAASIQTQGDFLTEVGALLGGSSLRQRASAARERAVIARDRDFGTAAAPAATETVASAEERAGLNALLGRETAHRTLEELAAAPAVTEDTTAADAAWDAAAAEIMASPAAAALAATVTPASGPSPEVVAKAVKQFQAELTAATPAITAIMAEPLPGEEPAKAEKPAKLFSVWVGWRIADMLIPLADETPATDLSSIGGKLRDAKQGRRLARTIRLTPAEREALAGYATQVENDAVAGKDAPLADSARTLRARLA